MSSYSKGFPVERLTSFKNMRGDYRFMVSGLVRHIGKYVYLLSFGELDENIDTNLMSVCKT